MPCSSRIVSEMTPQICYHRNYRITNVAVVHYTLAEWRLDDGALVLN